MQKSSKFKIAANYANAWFEVEKKKKIEDKVFEEIQLLNASYSLDKTVWNALASPIDDTLVRKNILETLAKKIKLSPVSTDALLIIAENGRISFLDLILQEFSRIYYEDKGIVEVLVETAVQLSDAQNKKLHSVLETGLNSKVFLKYQINPEVLGGLRVSFNSFLIDDTLQSKLNRIKLLLNASGGDAC